MISRFGDKIPQKHAKRLWIIGPDNLHVEMAARISGGPWRRAAGGHELYPVAKKRRAGFGPGGSTREIPGGNRNPAPYSHRAAVHGATNEPNSLVESCQRPGRALNGEGSISAPSP
jgi:hypothetical protein